MTMKRIMCAETHSRRLRIGMAVLALIVVGFRLTGSSARAASAESKAIKISIVNFQFTPAEVTIAPGESVTWVNDDGAPHGLEYHDGSAGKDLLLPGASYNRRFDQPGTYDYNCSVHPYMTGRVIVRAR
jgi:plastocyanin